MTNETPTPAALLAAIPTADLCAEIHRRRDCLALTLDASDLESAGIALTSPEDWRAVRRTFETWQDFKASEILCEIRADLRAARSNPSA